VLSWFRARPPPASHPGVSTHQAIRVYVPEVMGTFVRYFVVFLFLPGLYLRPDSGATNMRRDRLARFVHPTHVCTFAPTYLPTYVRPSVRPSVHLSVHSFVRSFVRSFIRSFSSIISRRFYIHYNLRGWRRRWSSAALPFYRAPCHANRE
jgi:hypothetical protein